MNSRASILRRYLGTRVHVVVDRPIGYDHKGLIYPINYGFLPGVLAGDGEEQDTYILGITVPLTAFEGTVIGAAVRKNDCEDKLIVAPEGAHFTREQMAEAVAFQEQFFDTVIVIQPEEIP